MEKQLLMEYLSTVCDAENAIYSCDEAISALQKQKTNFPQIQQPIPPTKGVTIRNIPRTTANVHTTKKENNAGNVGYLLTFVVLFVILMLVGLGAIPSLIIAVIGVIFIGPSVMDLITKQMVTTRLTEEYDQNDKKLEAIYNQELEDYNKKMLIYQRSITAENAYKAQLDGAIDSNNNMKVILENELQQLYDRNIIHASFRNIVAVNQIREYLDMGVCEALEGPTGAYAQYLQDVRTKRICDSISDLKETLVTAMNAILMSQATLVQELQTTNRNITQMNVNLTNGMNAIHDDLIEAQRASADQIDRCFEQANKKIESVEKTLATETYNQYIALRESNVRQYLLKQPY